MVNSFGLSVKSSTRRVADIISSFMGMPFCTDTRISTKNVQNDEGMKQHKEIAGLSLCFLVGRCETTGPRGCLCTRSFREPRL